MLAERRAAALAALLLLLAGCGGSAAPNASASGSAGPLVPSLSTAKASATSEPAPFPLGPGGATGWIPFDGELVSSGNPAVLRDRYGREQFLAPAAARAWLRMQRAARSDGVALELVSAFRSAAYQAALVARKVAAGRTLEQVLQVNAAPGFSEHHAGRAIDVSVPGMEPLEEDFETTEAFRWLASHAGDHGFRLSFPRGNRHGIAYEPWHWYYARG